MKLTQITPALTGVALLLAAAGATAQTQQPIHVEVDGSRIVFTDVQPQLKDGRVMVPLRGVFERLDANVGWNAPQRTVIVTGKDLHITLKIDANTAIVNEKEVWFDAPARIEGGRTLVPVRFLSETLGANVQWDASLHTVQITSAAVHAGIPPIGSPAVMAMIPVGTVVPFKLDTPLSSNASKVGDRFTGTIDTRGKSDYSGLPIGTKIEGRVDLAQPQIGSDPGVLGVSFDHILLPDGRKVPVYAQVIAVDEKNVQEIDGRLVARSTAKQEGHKFVWIGAGGGALLSMITKTNLLTGTVLGAALGYLYDEMQRGQVRANNVTLTRGADFGAAMDRDLVVYNK